MPRSSAYFLAFTRHFGAFLPIGLLIYASLLVSCDPAHHSSISIASPAFPQALFTIQRIEHVPHDTLRIARSQGELYARYDTTLRHPQLFLLSCSADTSRCIVLLEPGDHLTLHWAPRSIETYGSRQTARIIALQYRIARMRDTLRLIADAYSTVSRGGRYDSLRRLAISAHDSLLERERQYLLHFIDEEPYSKASLLALLAEYDPQRPFFPLMQYDTLYSLVLQRLRKVYPITPFLQLVAAPYDTLQRARAISTSSYTHLREGDTLSVALQAFLSRCAANHFALLTGFAFSVARNHCDTISPDLPPRDAPDGNTILSVAIVIAHDGQVAGAYTLPHAMGDAPRDIPIERPYVDSILHWLGARTTPMVMHADSKGIVRRIDAPASSRAIP